MVQLPQQQLMNNTTQKLQLPVHRYEMPETGGHEPTPILNNKLFRDPVKCIIYTGEGFKMVVSEWQQRMRLHEENHLFCFVSASRPTIEASICGEIIDQCLNSTRRTCKLLDCSFSNGNKCDNQVEVKKVFQDSVFCLLPPGDSFTRRSTFDSILAGCIPVFFHSGSAYAQYTWRQRKGRENQHQ
ncbi:hypothetical protein Ddye_023467 [Dipteronia dyeriana]|uniref:Exostosin GT47 domain-containing protein n=1 Tax=Dipteronia dyeriana TaxID=168575 RepID=A0AAD9TTY2_9ROSI|nr:hypothetical protein Ddye_023467 [Dipteronia dyeriana]